MRERSLRGWPQVVCDAVRQAHEAELCECCRDMRKVGAFHIVPVLLDCYVLSCSVIPVLTARGSDWQLPIQLIRNGTIEKILCSSRGCARSHLFFAVRC